MKTKPRLNWGRVAFVLFVIFLIGFVSVQLYNRNKHEAKLTILKQPGYIYFMHDNQTIFVEGFNYFDCSHLDRYIVEFLRKPTSAFPGISKEYVINSLVQIKKMKGCS